MVGIHLCHCSFRRSGAFREQWWLIGSSGGLKGAVVALREQWWLKGAVGLLESSGGSLVARPDCETAVLDSNPAQPTVDC
jgi:hypothetical protein